MCWVIGVNRVDRPVWCRDPVIGGNRCIVFAELLIDASEAEPYRCVGRLVSSGHGIEQELAGLRRLALRSVETSKSVQLRRRSWSFAQEIGLLSGFD